jgi:hypothetical protein
VVTQTRVYFSGETFSCPICSRVYVWSWDEKASTFSFRCVNDSKPCKHLTFRFNHWSGFDPNHPAMLSVRFVDWDKIRHLSIAGVFYVLTVLWSIAFAYFLPVGKPLFYITWIVGVAGFGTGAGVFVGKAMAR